MPQIAGWLDKLSMSEYAERFGSDKVERDASLRDG
jgi:hypothetical protein